MFVKITLFKDTDTAKYFNRLEMHALIKM